MPAQANLDKCSINELKVIKENLENEITKAEIMAGLVRTLTQSSGFPYAIFEVFAKVQDGVTFISEDLQVIWANDAAIAQINQSNANEIHNLTTKDFVGHYCYKALGKEEPCPHCACIKAMETKKTQRHIAFPGPLSDVTRDVWAIPIYNGSKACIIIARETHSKPAVDPVPNEVNSKKGEVV